MSKTFGLKKQQRHCLFWGFLACPRPFTSPRLASPRLFTSEALVEVEGGLPGKLGLDRVLQCGL